MSKNTYYTTVGLEIHIHLNTKTKMFCKCENNPFEADANTHICPVCTAQPGALPVPNHEAIRHIVTAGLAIGGTIADFSEFDRKQYFYPDLPKGYQLSQHQHPFVSGGELAGVTITRIHLEEDAGNNKHEGDHSLIDYNRAGVPLMELVTEPVIHSGEEAMHFAKELQLLLRYLGVSHANMERGEMRVEANISISPDPEKLGTKVEVKNLNSFNTVGRAIEYEVARMSALMDEGRGNEIIQETRGWDDAKQKTFHQRAKGNSADYRYLPDPDLQKFAIHKLFDLEQMRKELPEMPAERRLRYAKDFGIKDAGIEVFINDTELALLFEGTIIAYPTDQKLIQLTANYITSDIAGMLKNEEQGRALLKNIDPQNFAKLMQMTNTGTVNSRGAKDILLILVTDGGDPEIIAQEKGLIQQNDMGALELIVQKIIADNAGVVEDFKNGKENALKFLIGQGMKESKGSANPQVLDELFKKLLAQ